MCHKKYLYKITSYLLLYSSYKSVWDGSARWKDGSATHGPYGASYCRTSYNNNNRPTTNTTNNNVLTSVFNRCGTKLLNPRVKREAKLENGYAVCGLCND